MFWEPGGDEITPTIKLRRAPIAAKYADVIESLYAGAGEPARANLLASRRRVWRDMT
jgi:long-chain acyl-CoA synthetase